MRILVNEYCGHSFQLELSRELARRGHQVLHVFYGDNLSTPKGNTDAAGSQGLQIEPIHLPMTFSKHSLLTRRKVDRAYGSAVAERVLSFKPDVVISANMPLDGQKILRQAAHRGGAHFFFWLQDVYSFAIRFVVRRKLGILAGLATVYYQRLERKLLRLSDGVICIAPGFEELVLRWGVARERIKTIENWAPIHEVTTMSKDNPWAREHELNERFCFMYSGTLGMKHRPELLLALARRLEASGDAQLVVVAEGAGAQWLRAQAATVSPKALCILPFQPYSRLSEMLSSADVLIALLDSEAGAFAVPSKVTSYLCAQRAMLLAAPPENHAVKVVQSAQAGEVASPDSSAAFLDAAMRLRQDPELRRRYAHNARAYAEKTYDIQRICDAFLEFFVRRSV